MIGRTLAHYEITSHLGRVWSFPARVGCAEIGIRLALGAEPQRLMQMIVLQNGVVTVTGLFIGIVAALGTGRLIESLLYDVTPRDPVVFTATALTLLLMATFACWIPARRASRLNLNEILQMD